MKTPWNTLLVAANLAAFAMGACAQMPPALDDHAGMFQTPHSAQISPSRQEARMHKHMAELKQKLHITVTQEPAWTAFTAAMKPPANLWQAMPERAEMAQLTTPERIDKMKQLRLQHHEVAETYMNRRDDAIKTFYLALDEQQKKILDAEHAHMMGRHARFN
jgi:hypothetical protein